MSKTTKNQKQALVPRLRFPEFREAGEWEITPLSKLANRRTERNRDGELVRVLTNSAEHGVVDQREYFDKDIAAQGNLENYFIVGKGDFVYNPRISSFAPVGPISKNRVAKGVMSPLYTVFRFKIPDNDFYAHYFKSSAWHWYMRQVGSTGARHDRMAITNDDFMALPLPVPSAKEQQKIADCLSSLDALIAAQAEKIDALKTHKKGLMQQLFPRERETAPRLRFPEFRDAGEWEAKALAEIAEFYKGKGISKADIAANGSQSCIRYGELYTIYGELIEEVVSKTDLPPKGLFMSKAGDVIIPSSGETKLDIAKASCVARENIALGGDLNVIRSEHNGVFLSYYLNGTLKFEIARVSQGDSVVHLYRSNLEKLALAIPQSEEQQKIADCLSSLDILIGAQSERIDMLKTHKKGLMQQLFPSLEAVGT